MRIITQALATSGVVYTKTLKKGLKRFEVKTRIDILINV